MRILLPLAPTLLLLGCKPEFTELSEACHEKVPGARPIDNEDAVEFVHRTNCYRRLAGLWRGKLDKTVQEAVENHLDYVLTHRPWETGESWFVEHPDRAGFTGTDVFERMRNLDFHFEDPTGWGVWEFMWLDHGLPPDRIVDFSMPDPFWRQVFLQPDWRDGAYADAVHPDTGLHLGYGTMFYAFPTYERENNPVVYPRDGQVEVPWTYRSIDPFDSIFPHGDVGFPITVTFGDGTVTRFNPSAANPYNIELVEASLRGPDGRIDLHLILPPGDTANDLLRYTLVAVPLEVLEPDSRYVFEAEVRWGQERHKKVRSEFFTAKTPDFRTTWLEERAAQGARVSAPVVRHTPMGSLK